jgi:hypothetical protein
MLEMTMQCQLKNLLTAHLGIRRYWLIFNQVGLHTHEWYFVLPLKKLLLLDSRENLERTCAIILLATTALLPLCLFQNASLFLP